jgi:hypothetical protein
MMNNLLYCPHNIPLERRCSYCLTERRISYSRRLEYLNNLTSYENRLLNLQDIIRSYTFSHNRYMEIQTRQRIINDINFIINIINRHTTSTESQNILRFYNNLLTQLIFFNPNRSLNLLENNTLGIVNESNIISITDLNKNTTLEISEGSDDKCTICLEKFKNKEIKRVLGCNHEFHQCCIDKWLENHQKCPVCRTSILEN